jgi:hypothetical protein
MDIRQVKNQGSKPTASNNNAAVQWLSDGIGWPIFSFETTQWVFHKASTIAQKNYGHKI